MKNLRLKSVIQKSIISLFLAFFLITLISNAKAANIVQAATGNWNAGATWVGGVVPTSADDVTLLGNRTCTVNISNAACNTITIPNNGATGAPCALRFNVNSQLTVSGSVTMGTGGTRSANVDMTSGGTLICNGFVLGVGTKNFISGVGTVVLNATFTIPNTILTTFNNLTLNGGTITAPSGTLNITGNFVTNSNFVHNSGTLNFNGTNAQTVGGTVRPTLNNVTINNSSNEVELSSSIFINGILNFVGGKLNIKNFELSMIGSSSITGMSTTRYVKTSGTGKLKRSVGASAVLFPVGNTGYNPVEIINSGTSDVFGVYLIDNVTDDGSGVGATTSFPVVNRTWMLEEDVAGGSNASISLTWNSTDEVNSFNRVAGFMTHYESTSNLWDNIGGSVSGTDPYTIQSSGITSFSPFSISSGGGFAPLPTELVSFQAVPGKNRSVDVTWTTASELNSSHFTIHHSVDGQNWKAISTIGAANNSNEIINYSIIDNYPQIGLNYYRLTQFDTDGNYKQYDPVSVKNTTLTENTIVVYPNPGREVLKLELNNSEIEGEVILEIFNESGLLIETRNAYIQPGYNNLIVEGFNANNGIYFIQVRNEEFSSERVIYIKQ